MKKITLAVLLFFYFFYKRKIINFIKKKIKNIEILIDVGAHHGESVKLFVNNFSIKNIYSFEPSFDNFQTLIKNTKFLQKKKNIKLELLNYALGSLKKKLYLNVTSETSSSTINSINESSSYYKKKTKFLSNKNKKFLFKKEIIEVITLDSALLYKKLDLIDLIKIDTEGFEYEVLKGSKEILKKTKLVLFEHHYDNMILKNYNFRHINDFLVLNNFKKIFKAKMTFRKTFEYIYENRKKI